MSENKVQSASKKQDSLKENWREEFLSKIKTGTTIKVHQKIKEKGPKGQEKERIQIFEGIILAHKGGKGKGANITVRKIAAGGIGVERIFPVYSPNIVKIESIKQAKVNKSKLYYLRNYKKKLREKNII